MPKSTVTYWNPLQGEHSSKWEVLEGLDHKVEQLTLAIDENGDYTRLTRFKSGADTSAFGPKSHDYPEEIFIVSGRLYDAAFDCWLEQGHYASRPPGEVHGPFRAEGECLVLEMSFPSQAKQGE
ncbi:MAG: cupin domain-containing protein [Leptolyngbyaceae cyanobacterium bins.59]|nr:cupin domain-containing protein [Leptolyngbyaceae cyanobacterium bins.59]